VRLEAVRLGGRWLTSREALQRFADRLTVVETACPSEPPAGTELAANNLVVRRRSAEPDDRW
jgi:hypothetical protein